MLTSEGARGATRQWDTLKWSVLVTVTWSISSALQKWVFPETNVSWLSSLILADVDSQMIWNNQRKGTLSHKKKRGDDFFQLLFSTKELSETRRRCKDLEIPSSAVQDVSTAVKIHRCFSPWRRSADHLNIWRDAGRTGALRSGGCGRLIRWTDELLSCFSGCGV